MTDPVSPPPPPAVTLREIQELIRLFNSSGRAGIELKMEGFHLVLGRDGPPVTTGTPTAPALPVQTTPAQAMPAPTEETRVAAGSTEERREGGQSADAPHSHPAGGREHLVEVCSPAVGAFWTAPGPGQPPFVQIGEVVAADQQLGIVEVMKLMSHVSAPVAGTVIEVCATNSAFVEFDQVLFLIEPGHA